MTVQTKLAALVIVVCDVMDMQRQTSEDKKTPPSASGTAGAHSLPSASAGGSAAALFPERRAAEAREASSRKRAAPRRKSVRSSQQGCAHLQSSACCGWRCLALAAPAGSGQVAACASGWLALRQPKAASPPGACQQPLAAQSALQSSASASWHLEQVALLRSSARRAATSAASRRQPCLLRGRGLQLQARRRSSCHFDQPLT